MVNERMKARITWIMQDLNGTLDARLRDELIVELYAKLGGDSAWESQRYTKGYTRKSYPASVSQADAFFKKWL